MTQVLQLPKDPPSAVVAETARLGFYVSPLSSRGLLSQQVRDALKAMQRNLGGANIVKLRAFVAGSGDMRRVQAIVSETFTERRLSLPALSVVAAATYVPDPGIERYGGGTRTHVVRSGENLSVIAKRYGTTPAAIMRLNRLKKPIIFPGQELLANGKGRTTSVSTKTKRATSRNR